MRAAVLSAVVGLASAAAIQAPRAASQQLGYWYITVDASSAATGWNRQDLKATYFNDELEQPILFTCFREQDTSVPTTTAACTDPSVDWEYHGNSVSLTQTLKLGGETVTVNGEGDIDMKCGGGNGRQCHGQATIQVSSGIA